MIKIYISSLPDLYVSYTFEKFQSLLDFLTNLPYPLLGFHLKSEYDGKVFCYDLNSRLSVIYYANFYYKLHNNLI